MSVSEGGGMVSRGQWALEYFSMHFDFVRVTPVPAARWVTHADRMHTPFGFAIDRDAGELRLCLELIVEQTRGLGDEDLDVYLEMWRFHVGVHLSRVDLDGDELERVIDNAGHAVSPSGMMLMSRVQLAAV